MTEDEWAELDRKVRAWLDWREKREPPHKACEQELERACTCHPDDNPPVPCPRKFALTECRAAVLAKDST